MTRPRPTTLFAILVTLAAPFVGAIGASQDAARDAVLRAHHIDPASPLASRVGETPESVMKMFADAEKEGRQAIDTTVYNQVLGVMIEVVRSVVPDHFEEIMHRVGNNPVVAAILREQQARQELTP